MSNSADGEEADKGPAAEDVALASTPPPPRASSVASDASSAASSVASAPPTVTPRLSKGEQEPDGHETPPPPPPPPLTPSGRPTSRAQTNGKIEVRKGKFEAAKVSESGVTGSMVHTAIIGYQPWSASRWQQPFCGWRP